MTRQFITGAVDSLVDRFTRNNSGNAPALLMLGGFKFSLNTAVFQRMERNTAWRWQSQQRVGQLDALQFTGPADDRISLPGIVYPEFRGGAGQIDDLRAMGAEGVPHRLITADGRVLGEWVIERVEEVASEYRADGVPRRQEFMLTIRKFADGNL